MFNFSSVCRVMRRSVFVVFLFTVLLFAGCDKDGDEFVDDHKLNQKLIGTWTSEYSDGYTITDTYFSYGYGAGSIEYAGTIKYVSNFTDTAGVIIIEYDDNHKPKYYAEYDPDTYEPIGDPLPLKGNFIANYYENLKSGVSVQMGVAYIDGGAEEATLDAAKKAYTKGKRGDYISRMGTYSLQP